jgi:hypothetical protein
MYSFSFSFGVYKIRPIVLTRVHKGADDTYGSSGQTGGATGGRDEFGMGSGRTGGGPDYSRDQSGRDLGGDDSFGSSGRTGGGLGKSESTPTRPGVEACC